MILQVLYFCSYNVLSLLCTVIYISAWRSTVWKGVHSSSRQSYTRTSTGSKMDQDGARAAQDGFRRVVVVAFRHFLAWRPYLIKSVMMIAAEISNRLRAPKLIQDATSPVNTVQVRQFVTDQLFKR